MPRSLCIPYGFHAVPLHDHCRAGPAAPPRILQYTAREADLVESLMDNIGPQPRSLDRLERRAWRRRFWADGTTWQEQQDMMDAFVMAHRRYNAARRSAERAKLAARKAACALIICDPMAVQAKLILRAVLVELREAA